MMHGLRILVVAALWVVGFWLGGIGGLGGWGAPVWAATHASRSQLIWQDRPGAASSQYAHAVEPGQIQFPRDFGPHPDFQTEWWYYTGNLATDDGRPFGYQLTFFRSAVTPESTNSQATNSQATNSQATNSQDRESVGANSTTAASSAWRSNQFYSAHFTLSDIAGDRFYPYERYSRSGAALAGATAQPYEVWLNDWSATQVEETGSSPGSGPDSDLGLGKVRLRAQSEATAIDLVLEQQLPPVLQGDRGLSQKGKERGNASYYYSLVQQPTTGTLIVGDRTYAVSGLSWKDHEYSTSALSAGTVGWDWFSLQFDNGTALMLYGLRHEDGQFEPTSGGTFVQADGKTQRLALADVQIEVQKRWTSPHSQATYPAAWAIAIPKLDLQMQGKAMMADQELRTATATYWEGAVAFRGMMQGQSVQAQGYTELTGYADRLDSILSGDR